MKSLNNLNEKMELLQIIPRYRLEKIASENDISKSGNVKELRQKIANKFEYKKIEEIFEEYEDAGNATIYLYRFQNGYLKLLRRQASLLKLLKENDLEETFESRQRIELTTKPKIVLVKYKNKSKTKIKIVLEFKGKEIIARKADTRELIMYEPLLSITVVIQLNGLIEVRTRSRKIANKVIEIIAEHFNNQKHEKIQFNEENLEELINWAKIFRNANIKPLAGEISSLRMTAKKDSDLRKIDLYTNRTSFIGECIRTGIYLQFEYGVDNRKIGFQINPLQGKIYLKTMIGEEEIDFILSEIRKIKGF